MKKMTTFRDKKQAHFAKQWVKSKRYSILYLCPRFGKIRTTINIFRDIEPRTILIAYPDTTIEKSWKKDFKDMGFDDDGVTYTTHLSLHKHVGKAFDISFLNSKIYNLKIERF